MFTRLQDTENKAQLSSRLPLTKPNSEQTNFREAIAAESNVLNNIATKFEENKRFYSIYHIPDERQSTRFEALYTNELDRNDVKSDQEYDERALFTNFARKDRNNSAQNIQKRKRSVKNSVLSSLNTNSQKLDTIFPPNLYADRKRSRRPLLTYYQRTGRLNLRQNVEKQKNSNENSVLSETFANLQELTKFHSPDFQANGRESQAVFDIEDVSKPLTIQYNKRIPPAHFYLQEDKRTLPAYFYLDEKRIPPASFHLQEKRIPPINFFLENRKNSLKTRQPKSKRSPPLYYYLDEKRKFPSHFFLDKKRDILQNIHLADKRIPPASFYFQEKRIPPANFHFDDKRIPPASFHFDDKRIPPASFFLNDKRIPPANFYLDDKRIPPASFHFDDKRIPPASFFLDDKRIPPANFYLDDKRIPPASFHFDDKRIPPASFFLDDKRIPPANFYLDDKRIPPASFHFDDKRIPPANFFLDDKRIPPANFYLDDKRIPPASFHFDDKRIPPASFFLDDKRIPPANFYLDEKRTADNAYPNNEEITAENIRFYDKRMPPAYYYLDEKRARPTLGQLFGDNETRNEKNYLEDYNQKKFPFSMLKSILLEQESLIENYNNMPDNSLLQVEAKEHSISKRSSTVTSITDSGSTLKTLPWLLRGKASLLTTPLPTGEENNANEKLGKVTSQKKAKEFSSEHLALQWEPTTSSALKPNSKQKRYLRKLRSVRNQKRLPPAHVHLQDFDFENY